MKIEAGKFYVLKTVVSTSQITQQQQQYITTAINKGKFRQILVFSAPPLCLSLPVIHCLSSFTIPGSWAEVWDDKRWYLAAWCVFVVLSLTPSLRLQEPVNWETGDGSGSGGTGQNGVGREQRRRRPQRRTVPGGRHAWQVHLLLFVYSFYSTFLLTLLLSGCLFFPQSVTIGRAGRDVTNAWGESNAGW